MIRLIFLKFGNWWSYWGKKLENKSSDFLCINQYCWNLNFLFLFYSLDLVISGESHISNIYSIFLQYLPNIHNFFLPFVLIFLPLSPLFSFLPSFLHLFLLSFLRFLPFFFLPFLPLFHFLLFFLRFFSLLLLFLFFLRINSRIYFHHKILSISSFQPKYLRLLTSNSYHTNFLILCFYIILLWYIPFYNSKPNLIPNKAFLFLWYLDK